MNDKETTKAPGRKSEPALKQAAKGEKEGGRIRNFIARTPWLTVDRLKWVLLAILSILFAVCLFPNILSQAPNYQIGDIAKTGIKASHDFLVENSEQTEKNRAAAAKESLAVYDFDGSSSNLIPRLKEAFKFGRDRYAKLFSTKLPDAVEMQGQIVSAPSEEEMGTFKDEFFVILDMPPDDALFDLLLNIGFSEQVEQAAIPIINHLLNEGIVANLDRLLSHSEKGGIVLHDLYSQDETKVSNLEKFYDLDSANTYIENRADILTKKTGSKALAQAVMEVAIFLLQPNVTFNQRESEMRKEAARNDVKPTYFKIKKGEMLVREGERIGSEHLRKLEGEFRSRNRLEMLGRIPAMALLIGLFFAIMYSVGYRGTKLEVNRRDLLFNAVTLVGLFLFIWVYRFVADEIARGFTYLSPRALLYAMPVACGGMLLSIFQGMAAATSFSLAVSVLAALVCGGQVAFFVYFFLGSLMAAYGVRRCTERGTLIKAGLKVGLVNMTLALAMEMIYGSFYSMEPIIALCAGFAGGILTAIVATGLLPLMEMAFGYTTDIKLLELASLDQPLLRQLLVQAPGTYHHSVIISNLVEATAQAINANPLLAKVCAYYHDIGKMKKPQYFIENQGGGENKHEKLAPSMSSLILTAHVKDGVELAKRHGLGREIIDTIQQHHGTSLITYFYQKAKERAETNVGKYSTVKQEDFRYPGPKPQTKEAGLVMLADMVEAASRSLNDPTPSRIQGTVHKMINKAFSDGQLDECELTLKNLHEIAKSFNKTLGGIFHQRIKYPDPVEPRAEKKGRNGHSDQRPEDDSGARKQEDQKRTEEGLKRLGLQGGGTQHPVDRR